MDEQGCLFGHCILSYQALSMSPGSGCFKSFLVVRASTAELLGISLNKHLFCFFRLNCSTTAMKGSKVAKLQKLNPKLVQRSSQSRGEPSNPFHSRTFLWERLCMMDGGGDE
ncbi:hypothetical protein Droror1_Dr00005980 [Drosera rotundifolia]